MSPRERGPLALLVVALAIAMLGGVLGCGASTLDRAERAYGAAHVAQAAGVRNLHRRVREAVREDCPEGQEACAEATAGGFHEAQAGLVLSADALDTAARELEAAALGDESAQVCARVKDALASLGSALELLRALNVRIPEMGRLTLECD